MKKGNLEQIKQEVCRRLMDTYFFEDDTDLDSGLTVDDIYFRVIHRILDDYDHLSDQ